MAEDFQPEDRDEAMTDGAVNSRPPLNKKERRVFVIFSIFAVLVVVFGFWQLGRQIGLPSERQIAEWQKAALNSNGSLLNLEGVDVAGLQAKDTDKDGLSDYDELYIYHTSPYLEDTDGDGINDKKEVDAGTDPLCPAGQDCYGTADSGAVNANAPLGVTDNLGSLLDSMASGSAADGLATTTPTPAELRDILIQSGMSADTVNKFTDQQLLQMYQQVASGGSAATNTNSGQTGAAVTQPTPAELRTLLIQSGLPADTVNKFTDQQLLQVYQQVSSGSSATTNTNSGQTSAQSQALIALIDKMSPADLRAFLLKNGFSEEITKQYDDATLKKTILDLLAK